MYPTIIFCFAILTSIMLIYQIPFYLIYFNQLKNDEKLKQTMVINILIIIVPILWSWLYYLSH